MAEEGANATYDSTNEGQFPSEGARDLPEKTVLIEPMGLPDANNNRYVFYRNLSPFTDGYTGVYEIQAPAFDGGFVGRTYYSAYQSGTYSKHSFTFSMSFSGGYPIFQVGGFFSGFDYTPDRLTLSQNITKFPTGDFFTTYYLMSNNLRYRNANSYLGTSSMVVHQGRLITPGFRARFPHSRQAPAIWMGSADAGGGYPSAMVGVPAARPITTGQMAPVTSGTIAGTITMNPSGASLTGFQNLKIDKIYASDTQDNLGDPIDSIGTNF